MIPGFENYEISTNGVIRNIESKLSVIIDLDKSGYYTITLF